MTFAKESTPALVDDRHDARVVNGSVAAHFAVTVFPQPRQGTRMRVTQPIGFVVCFALVFGTPSFARTVHAQVRASERATISQTADGTNVTIDYARPRARGALYLKGSTQSGLSCNRTNGPSSLIPDSSAITRSDRTRSRRRFAGKSNRPLVRARTSSRGHSPRCARTAHSCVLRGARRAWT